jgi:hypothetical protein
MRVPIPRWRPFRWLSVVAIVLGLALVAAPVHAAALPGQYLGSDTLVALQRMIAWSTNSGGIGWPGAVNSQYIIRTAQAISTNVLVPKTSSAAASRFVGPIST